MLNWLFKKLIRGYQVCVSPFLVPACRFHPSCSEYSYQALDRYPLFRALGKILARIGKCHPFHDGGFDPLK